MRATELICRASFMMYAVVTLVHTWHHEPWRDEAQSWLLARDTSLAVLAHQLAHEWSPPLWYLLIRPLAKLGAPYESQALLNWAIAMTGGWLLTFRAPLPWPVRLVLLWCEPFLYLYPAIARPYALGATTMFAACALVRRRFQSPRAYALALAALTNSTVLLSPAGAALSLAFAREVWGHRRGQAAVCILAAGVLVAAYTLYPANPAGLVRKAFGNAASTRGGVDRLVDHVRVAGATTVLTAVAVVCLAGAAQRSRRAVAALALGLAGMHLSCHVIYACGLRHYHMLVPLLVAVVWTARDQGCLPAWEADRDHARRALYAAGLAALLAAQIAGTWSQLPIVRFDYTHPYSGGRGAAAVLAAVPASAAVSAFPAVLSSSPLPYLPGRRFWYPEYDRFGTFTPYGMKRLVRPPTLPDDCVIALSVRSHRPGERVYLITTSPRSPSDPAAVRLVGFAPGWLESYWIYELMPASRGLGCGDEIER